MMLTKKRIARRPKNPLYIFDFDDTLVRSSEKIHVRHANGRVSTFTTHEFTLYEPKPGDVSDFKEFEKHLSKPQLLPHYDIMLDKIDAVGIEHVMILTARTYHEPVARWLASMGIVGMTIVPLGGTTARAKADWIRARIGDAGHDLIEFYDDNEHNVSAVQALEREFKSVRIVTKWVH